MQYSGAGQQGPRKDTDSCPKKKHDMTANTNPRLLRFLLLFPHPRPAAEAAVDLVVLRLVAVRHSLVGDARNIRADETGRVRVHAESVEREVERYDGRRRHDQLLTTVVRRRRTRYRARGRLVGEAGVDADQRRRRVAAIPASRRIASRTTIPPGGGVQVT